MYVLKKLINQMFINMNIFDFDLFNECSFRKLSLLLFEGISHEHIYYKL